MASAPDSPELAQAALAIVAATTDMVGTATPDGRVRLLNRAGRALLGLEEEGSLGEELISSYHPAWAWELIREEAIPTAIRDGSWSGETAILSRGGEEIPVWQLILAHRGESGEVAFISTLARDLRPRRDAELRLRERIKELRTLYAVARITAGWDRPLEARLQELVEALPSGWLHPEHTEAEIRLGRTLCRTPGHQGFQEVLEAPVRNGTEVVGSVRVGIAPDAPRLPGVDSPFLPEERDLLEAVAGSIGKALEREALQESLVQAQKIQTIGRLAGGTAHDFNNLLTVIKGHAALAMDTLPPEHPAREDLEHLLASAERGSRLTSQLLAFSRKQHLEARRVDLRELVAHLDPMLRRLVPSRIELVMGTFATPVPAWVDPGKLEQVVMNLVVNAVDAIPEHGTLEVFPGEVRIDAARSQALPWEVEPGTWSSLTVRDSGEGMPPEVLRRIFEPFFTTKPVGSGTGLGLSMAYGFVKQSRGHILVDSVPGEGTRFQILLPREPARPSAPGGPGDPDARATVDPEGAHAPEAGWEQRETGVTGAAEPDAAAPGAPQPGAPAPTPAPDRGIPGDPVGGDPAGASMPHPDFRTLDPREPRTLEGPMAPAGVGPVLVVDDSPQVRAVMLRTLARAGYPVLESPHGEAALELLAREDGPRPFLVITDLVMPRVGGALLLERIREAHPRTAVLLVSGYPRRELVPVIERSGVDFLAKPFSARELLQAVRKALPAR